MSTRDLELVQLVLRYRDYQRAIKRLAGIPVLLEKLRKVPPSAGAEATCGHGHPLTPLCSPQAQDFYVEMKWEFTSWGELGAQHGYGRSGHFPAESPSPSIHPQVGGHLPPCPLTPQACRPPSHKGIAFPRCVPHPAQRWQPPRGCRWPHPQLGSWHLSPVPLVSKICPSDTYKVWKSGQNLRVDTTLLGFDHMTWQRGNRSFVFRGQGEVTPGCPPHWGVLAEPARCRVARWGPWLS